MEHNNTIDSNQVVTKLGLNQKAHHRILRTLMPLMVIVVIGGALYWLLLRNHKVNNAIHYETVTVTRGGLIETVTATGTLAPVNEVEIGSEISGTIEAVEVDYNSVVTNGEVLARIEPSKLLAQVQQAEAAVAAAKAGLLNNEATQKEAEAQLARLRQAHELSGGQVPSRNELDIQEAAVARAIAGVASAAAEISRAQATLSVNRSDLEKAVITSPINGIVLSRSIEPGQTVAASFTAPVLFTLAEDLAKLELQVDVDEADVGRVHKEQTAAFTVDAFPDRQFPATITQVRYGSKTTDGVVTYTTVMRVANDALLLRPGMTATAIITTRKVEDAILIPNAALRFVPPPEPTLNGAGNAKETKRPLIRSLLPAPPRRTLNQHDARKASVPTVYALVGEQPRRVQISAGFSDGMHTEVLDDSLTVGMELITAMKTGGK